MSLRLTNIQRFCVNDGPGIRTTLFTKGCSIRCPWCSNPENLSSSIQYYKNDQCFAQNGKCSFNIGCAINKDTVLQKSDYENCPINAIGIYGHDYQISKLKEICLKDHAFYGKDGGITASGGEALLQAKELAILFSAMHKEGISCCIETSLYSDNDNLRLLTDYLDYIYIDFKILDPLLAKQKLNGNFMLFEKNIEYLFTHIPREKICVRFPVVKGYTYTGENISLLCHYLKNYKPGLCEIFSVHNLGKAKYESLHIPYDEFTLINDRELAMLKSHLGKCTGISIKINKL